MPNPLFLSTSTEKPQLLTISFADDPQGSLGAQLVNADKVRESCRILMIVKVLRSHPFVQRAQQGEPQEMFCPGFATIGRLLDGETIAKKSGVHVGDCIVAVNGEGFRRFAPDFEDSELQNLSKDTHVPNNNKVLHMGKGEAYQSLLTKIKAIKAATGSPPLTLSLERYTWDSKLNSWPRFLEARARNVPAAMKMLQEHEIWKKETFPIDLTRDGIQEVLRLKAVAEIDLPQSRGPPVVYVNFSKLQTVESISPDDVCKAFLIFTEMMLARAKDSRTPKASQCKRLSS